MRVFKSKYFRYFLALSIFALGYALIHKSWYFSLDPITKGDLGFLYRDSYTDLLNTLSPVWNGGINFGANSVTTLPYFGYNFWGAVIAKFGFDYNFILRFVLFYPILIGYIISTLFVAKIFKKNVIITLIFGFVFAINTFIFAWVNMMAAYAILPIVIFALYEYLHRRKIVYLLIFCLAFAGTLVYEVRIGFIASLLSFLLVIFYWVYNPLTRKAYLTQLAQLLFSIVITFLLCAFFIFPLFHTEDYSSISDVISRDLFGTQFYKLQYSIALMQPYWNGETLKVFFLQPIKFYFWIYPILAFSALFFAKKDKKIIYFSLIAIFGIFMGKGANIPFGSIYAWTYYNLPFFNFFREPLQWWVVINLSYAVLIAYFFYYFYQEIEKIVKRKFKKRPQIGFYAKVFVTLPIVFVILSIALPAFDGRLGHGLNPVSFATEYDLFREFLIKEKNFYRTLSVPINQRFTYFSDNHPYVAFNYLPDDIKSLNTKLLSLESIRYVVLPNDVLNDVFINKYSSKQYEDFIESKNPNSEYNPLKRVAGFGNIKMWENPNDIPHLMAVKDLVYVVGPQKITDFVNIPTSKQVAYYSEQNIPFDATNKTKEVLSRTNEEMYKNATKIYSVADCVRCDLSKNYYDYVQFPFARFLPDSFLYPLIESKDSNTLNSITTAEEKFRINAFFAEKRAIEVQAMIKKNNPERYNKYIINTLTKANMLLADMENKFKEIASGPIDNGLLVTSDYIYTQRRTYDDLYQEENNEQVAQLLSKITHRLNGLIAMIAKRVWVTEGDEKKLTIDVPQDGVYDVLVKNDDEINLRNAKLTLNGNSLQQLSIVDNEFLNYGNQQLIKGKHFLALNTPPMNLLELSFSPDEIIGEDSISIISLKDSRSQYLLSFDYKVSNGRSSRLFISDDAYPLILDPSNGNLILDMKLINHNDEEWHHFNVFFSPTYEIKNPVLHLKGKDENSDTVFRNLSLVKVANPTIVFVRDTGKVLDVPKITYQEITSTDYIIEIENAQNPYLLSFSEQFDGAWTTLNTNLDFAGNKTTVAKYFDNSIEEKEYVNRLEPAVSIDSLTNRSETDSLHMKLNGFSNGWLINKNGTYKIHLTFIPQKYFLIGLIISALTLSAILVAIGIFMFKNRKEVK